MTVRELIAELSKYPENMEVFGGEIYLNEYKVIDVLECHENGETPYVGLELG
ncbi:MAG: hypothetical protein HDS87_06965 [Bacteroidales bacterium]|nr:hypothetical protein [Bacteroidales bacterium]